MEGYDYNQVLSIEVPTKWAWQSSTAQRCRENGWVGPYTSYKHFGGQSEEELSSANDVGFFFFFNMT